MVINLTVHGENLLLSGLNNGCLPDSGSTIESRSWLKSPNRHNKYHSSQVRGDGFSDSFSTLSVSIQSLLLDVKISYSTHIIYLLLLLTISLLVYMKNEEWRQGLHPSFIILYFI